MKTTKFPVKSKRSEREELKKCTEFKLKGRIVPITHGFFKRSFRPVWWAYVLLGPASRGDYFAPIVHAHDDFEQASEKDLAGFEVETDARAYRYAVRRVDLPKEHL
jgi:hypothetical protein